jgi:hypothetical protein
MHEKYGKLWLDSYMLYVDSQVAHESLSGLRLSGVPKAREDRAHEFKETVTAFRKEVDAMETDFNLLLTKDLLILLGDIRLALSEEKQGLTMGRWRIEDWGGKVQCVVARIREEVDMACVSFHHLCNEYLDNLESTPRIAFNDVVFSLDKKYEEEGWFLRFRGAPNSIVKIGNLLVDRLMTLSEGLGVIADYYQSVNRPESIELVISPISGALSKLRQNIRELTDL